MFLRQFSVIVLLLITPAIYATPTVKEIFQNYDITGQSADDLRQQMSMLGPMDIGDEHFDASTHWYVRWQYKYEETENACHLTAVDVNVDITYQFPFWVNYAVAEYALKSHWNTYIQHLLTHEKGHAENGVKAGIEIERALKELPVKTSRAMLTETADAIAYQIIAMHNTMDIHYEDETSHGATQGAVFP